LWRVPAKPALAALLRRSVAEKDVHVGSKHPRGILEAEPLVERPRALIRGVDAQNDIPPALLAQDGGDCEHQCLRNSSAALVRPGVEAEHVAEVLARCRPLRQRVRCAL